MDNDQCFNWAIVPEAMFINPLQISELAWRVYHWTSCTLWPTTMLHTECLNTGWSCSVMFCLPNCRYGYVVFRYSLSLRTTTESTLAVWLAHRWIKFHCSTWIGFIDLHSKVIVNGVYDCLTLQLFLLAVPLSSEWTGDGWTGEWHGVPDPLP